MPLQPSQSIGIFDSGIGGLTVARAIKRRLPQESIIYFGDTAHLPYGDKSAATVQTYAMHICQHLLQAQCKVIIIACNTAAAVAQQLIEASLGAQVHILSVIDPMVQHLQTHFQGQTIGLIGTKRTILSNIYAQKVAASQADIQLKPLATPLLVPMIEAGWAQDRMRREVVHRYLQAPILQDIQGLVLGCTHYPVIKHIIKDFYAPPIAILDATELTARALQRLLAEQQLLHTGPTTRDLFMVSDLTEDFAKAAQLFFDQPICLEQVTLKKQLPTSPKVTPGSPELE